VSLRLLAAALAVAIGLVATAAGGPPAAAVTASGGPGAAVPGQPATGATDSWSHDRWAGSDRELADPGVLEVGGRVHAYATSAWQCGTAGCGQMWVPRFEGLSLRRPGRLVGDAMPDRPAWVSSRDRDIWAPSVVAVGGGYTMYFGATAAGGSAAGMKCIGRARADRPEGPFLPADRPLRCTRGYWNIDPSVVEDGGRRFLLWREDDAAHVTGKIVVAELAPDGRTLVSRPRTLVTGTEPWEDGYPPGSRSQAPANRDVDHDATVDTTTVGARHLPDAARTVADPVGIGPVENPSMARHPATGEWLLTWSANRWETQRYATGLALCAGPAGPCLRVTQGAPWLRRSTGPNVVTSAAFGGAGGMTLVADGGDLYAVFHAYRGDGHHPAQPRIAWAYRVVPAGPARYQLTEL
jgi:glycosyl hydrolase family 43